MIFTINGCSIDTDAFEVRRSGTPVPVEPQVFDLLVQLLQNRDRVVTRDEIIEKVWHGRIVSEAAISSCIKAVRRAIGDDGSAQACIQTIRGRGFRVVADVTQCAGHSGAPAAATAQPALDPAAPAGPRASRWHVAALAGIAAVVLSLAAGLYGLRAPGQHAVIPIAAAALGMPAGPGIAVRHFDSPPGDGNLDFFGDALTEEIITELTRYSELRVAGRGMTAEFDRRDLPAPEVGRVLGVEYVVQGRMQRANDRVRVTAQLMKAKDSTVLWAEVYERPLTPADMFSVQEDIASKVVAAIASISAGVIARDALGQAKGKPPRDLSAYACTIRASEIMAAGFSADAHLAFRACLEAAVATEPDYAAAWAMLAWIHTLEFSQGYNKIPDSDPRERALAAARRAIQLAPANPMARFAMARASYLAGDLELFRAEAAHALRLNPHEPFLLGNLGSWLAFSGRWDDGVAMVRKAIALNPKVYPRWWHAALGKDHYRKREYREALAEFKTMNLPGWYWNQIELAYAYGQLGEAENARKSVAALIELYPGFDLEKAASEHRKFSFEQSYIEHALDGLRKAGVPEKTPTY
jgi:TolB-like protein/DNA-binding winged helix-turn-helix (wHTH) protein/tetratricopeptide (TPR) repeat protein